MMDLSVEEVSALAKELNKAYDEGRVAGSRVGDAEVARLSALQFRALEEPFRRIREEHDELLDALRSILCEPVLGVDARAAARALIMRVEKP
jgi:hypothetical protein